MADHITVYKGFEVKDGGLHSAIRFFFPHLYATEEGRAKVDHLVCRYKPGVWRNFGSPRFVFDSLINASASLGALRGWGYCPGVVQIWECLTTEVYPIHLPSLPRRPMSIRSSGFRVGDKIKLVVLDLKLIKKVEEVLL